MKEILTLKKQDFKAKCKYENKHGILSNDEWRSFYVQSFACRVPNTIKVLQFKILHRFVASNKFLHKIGKSASPRCSRCSFCHLQHETIEHLFYDCIKVKSFWVEVINCWNVRNSNVLLDQKLVIFGSSDVAKGDVLIALNTVLLVGKMFEWLRRKRPYSLSITNFKTYLVKFIVDTQQPERIATLLHDVIND